MLCKSTNNWWRHILKNDRPEDWTQKHLQEFNVSASRRIPQYEPSNSFDIYRSSFTTSNIQLQLGAMGPNQSWSDRAILNLSGHEILQTVADRRSHWSVPKSRIFSYTKPWFDVSTPTYPWIASRAIQALGIGKSLAYCVFCDEQLYSNDTSVVNIVQGSIFNDTLIKTGSPALALQAQLTMLMRLAYYAWLPLFDAEANVTTTSFSSSLVPISYRGFWAVVGILAAHIILTTLISFLFITRTKYSTLGNAWSSIVQIARAEDTQTLIQDGMFITGSEISQHLQKHKVGSVRYRIRTKGNNVLLAPVVMDDGEGKYS